MQELNLEKQGEFCYSISATNSPRLFIDPGETIVVETQDAFSGQVRKDSDRRDLEKRPYANPLSGPIYVRGASKGDALAIKIDGIQPLTGQGATRYVSLWYTSKSDTDLFRRFTKSDDIPHGTRVVPIKDGSVHYDGFVIPYRPMLGVLAVADPMESHLNWLAGPHGGNMDCPEVSTGATLYLPVRVEGGLLHLGDAHAVQGDGELSGSAVEMQSRTTLTIGLIKDKAIGWPRLETQDALYVISATEAGRTMEEAIRVAYVELMLWLEEEYGLERWRSFGLLTFVGKVQICNFWTVAAGIPKKYLAQLRGASGQPGDNIAAEAR